jgi:hypothetical protein
LNLSDIFLPISVSDAAQHSSAEQTRLELLNLTGITKNTIWTEFGAASIHARCEEGVCELATKFPKTNGSGLIIQQKKTELTVRCYGIPVKLPAFLDVTIFDPNHFCAANRDQIFWHELFRRFTPSFAQNSNPIGHKVIVSRYQGTATHTYGKETIQTQSQGSCVHLQRGKNFPYLKMCPSNKFRDFPAKSNLTAVGSRIEAEIMPQREEILKAITSKTSKSTELDSLISPEIFFSAPRIWKISNRFLLNDEPNCEQTRRKMEIYLQSSVKTQGIIGSYITDHLNKLTCAISWVPVSSNVTVTYIPRKNIVFIHRATTKRVGIDSLLKIEDGSVFLRCWGNWIPYEYFASSNKDELKNDCQGVKINRIHRDYDILKLQSEEEQIIHIWPHDLPGGAELMIVGPNQIIESVAAPESTTTIKTKRMNPDVLRLHSDMRVQLLSDV